VLAVRVTMQCGESSLSKAFADTVDIIARPYDRLNTTIPAESNNPDLITDRLPCDTGSVLIEVHSHFLRRQALSVSEYFLGKSTLISGRSMIGLE
jgi:hypothetical protein